jgi:hypothetical protein
MFHFYKRSMDEAVGRWALLTVALLRGDPARLGVDLGLVGGEAAERERCADDVEGFNADRL